MLKITSNFNSSKLANDLKRQILNHKFPCPHCKRNTISTAKAGNIVCPSCGVKVLIKK
jgi:DNA-directed RNA polymerase subunit RPC12/RpoP